MAVDNFYRLIVRGPRGAASAFRRSVAHTVNRPKVGSIKGWREFVPLSIAAIQSHCEDIRQVTCHVLDPYEVSAWPTRRVGSYRAEIRYQFQTRNSEFIDYLKPLSRHFPSLTFVLVTLWLDDSQIASVLVRRGVATSWKVGQTRRQWHWDLARKRFGIDGEDVYEDDAATSFAEDGMLDEALDHWMPKTRARSAHRAGGHTRTPSLRRRAWWNRPKVRDLGFERHLSLLAVNEEEKELRKRRVRSRKAARGSEQDLVPDEILLDRRETAIKSVEQLSQLCLRTLTERVWQICCWPKGISGHYLFRRFLVLSTTPNKHVNLYVQLWSEPRQPVLLEACSGAWNPGALPYVGPEQRTMFRERGYRVRGPAKNFAKDVKIFRFASAEAAAHEMLEIFFDVFGYRGNSALELKYER